MLATARWVPTILRSLLVAVSYLVAWIVLERLSLFLAPTTTGVYPWYPAAGLSLFLLIRFGLRYTPLMALGSPLVWFLFPHGQKLEIWPIVLFGLVATIGYGLAATLLVRFFRIDRELTGTRDLTLFFFIGGIVTPYIVALFSIKVLMLNGFVPASQYHPQVFRFWLGDVTGIFTLAPLLFYLFNPAFTSHPVNRALLKSYAQRHPLETGVQIIAVVAVPILVVHQFIAGGGLSPDVLYITFVPVGWIVIRHGLIGASYAALVTDVATLVTMRREAADLWTETELQIFLLTVSSIAYALGMSITERAIALLQLHHTEALLLEAQNSDPLTGLATLRSAQDALGRILPEHVADGESLVVIWYDVENLGIINDSLGTDAGDAFLTAIAERVRGLIDPGEIAARVASNFVIVLRGPSALRERCEAGLAVLSRRYQIATREIFPSAVIGYCVYDDPAMKAPEMFRRAHSAMRRAKHGSGSRIKSYSRRRDTNANHLETLARLHRAADDGDFELFYQPIVALASGIVTGAEALLRWNADGKILAPADFFPALERSALMDRVGWWAIREAIAQAGRWHNAGRTLDVWINVAARLLVDPGFAGKVIALIDDSGTDAGHIIIEVTERDAMHDLEKMSAIFRQLRARGLRIAIDDFGVGESSLARLRDVDVDILKIDGSFVTGIPADVRALNLVRNVVAMANTLGLRTVAEWIEGPEQADAVLAVGADLGQGFHLGRPGPPGTIFPAGTRLG